MLTAWLQRDRAKTAEHQAFLRCPMARVALEDWVRRFEAADAAIRLIGKQQRDLVRNRGTVGMPKRMAELPGAGERRPVVAVKTRAAWARQRDGYRCVYCGSGEGLTVDHVIPLARGGSNELSNLATCCGPCNSSKGARLLSEWRGRGVPA